MQWKQIEGFENYSVSDTGLVMNTKKGKILKQKNTYDGYYEVRLYSKTRDRYIRVHRLVALAFIPNPDELETVDHINGDKKDNRVENLQWCSKSDNTKRFWKEQITKEQKARYEAQKKPIKCIENGIIYESIAQAAEQLGLKRASLVGALSKKRNSLLGYHFELVKEKSVC